MKYKEYAILKVDAILKQVSANSCFMLNYSIETTIFQCSKNHGSPTPDQVKRCTKNDRPYQS